MTGWRADWRYAYGPPRCGRFGTIAGYPVDGGTWSPGGVSEWLKELVSKTSGCHSLVGSNPTPSAGRFAYTESVHRRCSGGSGMPQVKCDRAGARRYGGIA